MGNLALDPNTELKLHPTEPGQCTRVGVPGRLACQSRAFRSRSAPRRKPAQGCRTKQGTPQGHVRGRRGDSVGPSAREEVGERLQHVRATALTQGQTQALPLSHFASTGLAVSTDSADSTDSKGGLLAVPSAHVLQASHVLPRLCFQSSRQPGVVLSVLPHASGGLWPGLLADSVTVPLRPRLPRVQARGIRILCKCS